MNWLKATFNLRVFFIWPLAMLIVAWGCERRELPQVSKSKRSSLVEGHRRLLANGHAHRSLGMRLTRSFPRNSDREIFLAEGHVQPHSPRVKYGFQPTISLTSTFRGKVASLPSLGYDDYGLQPMKPMLRGGARQLYLLNPYNSSFTRPRSSSR